MKIKVMIVDDEAIIRKSLCAGLKDSGYDVTTAADREEALRQMVDFRPHIILTDMRLGDDNGIALIPELKALDSDAEIIVMTAFSDIKSAVSAIKSGAFDYINKPFDLDQIKIVIMRAFRNRKLSTRLFILEKRSELSMENMVGTSPPMHEVYRKIDKLSAVDNVTVVIRGETGTGKELVAEAIHKNSARKDFPLLRINCSAIPKHLVESELFGFEKNAFTGATEKKKGLFEIADGGTVFLDEFGEITLDMQAKLLRFLEERRFRRIGGLVDIDVDIRVITATNKDLEKAVKDGTFREDLYYRINVVPIDLPPLRQRGEDILLLADYYLDKFCKKSQKDIHGFSEPARDILLNYNWPGNIRELRNVVERLVILTDSPWIKAAGLPPEIQDYRSEAGYLPTDSGISAAAGQTVSLEEELDRVEKRLILNALDKASWNQTKAAEYLNVSRFTLKRKMEKHGL